MSTRERARVRGAWWATVVLFLVHGLVVGSWVSRIPAVKTALQLDNGVLGLTLLSAAAGAVCTIPVTGWLLGRFGSKKTTILSSIGFCLSLLLPGFARTALTLAAALFVYGTLAAAMDVSMNTHGVEVEKALGKPTMSRFHAMFSLGAMGGAALGGWAAAAGLTPLTHFAIAGMASLAAVLAVSLLLLPPMPASGEHPHRLPLNRIPRVLIALSAIGFCILLSEGAMADWIAIYLRQVLHAGSGLAAEGYAVFAAAMAVFRLAGDAITTRLGPYRTVCTGSLIAAGGLVCALAASRPLWAFPGFAAAGAGLSVIIPLVFGGGGRVKSVPAGAGIATVTGLGYLGFIVGPPAIGFASQVVTLRFALGIVVGCCLLSALLARAMGTLQAPTYNEPAPELHL